MPPPKNHGHQPPAPEGSARPRAFKGGIPALEERKLASSRCSDVHFSNKPVLPVSRLSWLINMNIAAASATAMNRQANMLALPTETIRALIAAVHFRAGLGRSRRFVTARSAALLAGRTLGTTLATMGGIASQARPPDIFLSLRADNVNWPCSAGVLPSTQQRGVADPSELKLPTGEPSKKELAMAEQLIASMAEKWEPEKWKDEYRDALMKLIEEKVAAPNTEVKVSKTARRPTNVVDLVSILQESLNANSKGGSKKKKAKAAATQVRRKAA
jgi:hypothetical protein